MTIDQQAKSLLLRKEVVLYHDNGKMSAQYYAIDDKPDDKLDGEYKEWLDNGQLIVHCLYKNNKLDGECKIWDDNGKLIYYELYKDGEVVKDYLK